MLDVELQYGRGDIKLECHAKRKDFTSTNAYIYDNALAIAGAVWDLLDGTNDNDDMCKLQRGPFFEDNNEFQKLPIAELMRIISKFELSRENQEFGFRFFSFVLQNTNQEVSTKCTFFFIFYFILFFFDY